MKEFLRSVPILSDLSDQEIELLAKAAEERRFAADECIVRKDEPGSSAFILEEGSAEARIERPGGTVLHLSRIEPGELFGELALFDETPRSATVVATSATTVIEIKRELFLKEVARNPDAALRLLSLLAKRLRRAESIVSDFSDRIYGDVLPRLQESVSAQLEAAKTICDETRKRAESTIEQARHLQDTADQHWTNLVRIGSVVGILVLGGGMLASIFGYNKIDDVAAKTVGDMSESLTEQFKDQLSEVEKLRSGTRVLKEDAEHYVVSVKEKIDGDLRDLELMRQTALEFDKMRRDLQLENGDIEEPSVENSGDLARDFHMARNNLLTQYFQQPSKWESEILIEAMDLLAEISARHYVVVDDNDWDHVNDAIEQAMKQPPNHWRQRLKLNQLVVKLYGNMVDAGYQKGARSLVKKLEDLLASDSQSPDAVVQTALVLAQLGSTIAPVKTQLWKTLDDDNPWRRNQAAISLIILDEDAGWQTLRNDLAGQFKKSSSVEGDQARRQREMAAFAAAQQLAERSADKRTARDFTFEILDRQLSADRLAQHLSPWPAHARTGADLIGHTIVEGLTRKPSRWNRFYWQFSCELVCNLGCQAPAASDGGKWCLQCVDGLKREYLLGGAASDLPKVSCRHTVPSS